MRAHTHTLCVFEHRLHPDTKPNVSIVVPGMTSPEAIDWTRPLWSSKLLGPVEGLDFYLAVLAAAAELLAVVVVVSAAEHRNNERSCAL